MIGRFAVLYQSYTMINKSTITKGICFGILTAGFISNQTFAVDDSRQLTRPDNSLSTHQGETASLTAYPVDAEANRPKRADFLRERASPDARYIADWIVDSGDNRGMPFVIVDKISAKVFVFKANGRLRGAAPALLGLALGDDSVPGIGNRKLSTIRPDERTTPAGRFVAALGHNLHGEEILWVDYDSAISLHRVLTTNIKEHRAQRLSTPTTLDKRISYGCINVPAKFYENVVSPAFTGTNGIVYVLPETRSFRKVFASYDVDERARQQATAQGASRQPASPIDANLAEHRVK